jgi:hypothetical protein
MNRSKAEGERRSSWKRISCSPGGPCRSGGSPAALVLGFDTFEASKRYLSSEANSMSSPRCGRRSFIWYKEVRTYQDRSRPSDKTRGRQGDGLVAW